MGGIPGTGRSFEERLAPHPASVGQARGQVRELLAHVGRDDLSETAALLTSELVTNALLHAGTVMDVSAEVDERGLLLGVRDGGPHLPLPRDYAATAGTGRGLRMLQQLVADWGVTRHRVGKTVWFRLTDADPAVADAADRRTDGAERGREADAVTIRLLDMPLLLHTAWQEHAQTMLREYLLASLDSDEDPISTHAEAMDAIALLEENVPRLHVQMEPDKLMNDVTEPGVSVPQLDLVVPRASVASFVTLDRVIDAALRLQSEGVVLTPPTEPEVQAFRRWVGSQVVDQAAGAAPVPWAVPPQDDDAITVPAGWDPHTVTDSEHGLLAANLSSHIIAVSRSAAALLGYDDPAELVGRRLISIIPERFHQAHVAGFTMYLLVGRKPLLDQTIVVPAVRRDGAEVDLRLTVRSHSVGNGERLMLADVQPADG